MANWCSNYVTFVGKKEDIEKVFAVFEEMSKQEQTTKHGQLSPFHNNKVIEGYFFEIYVEENMKECVSYETKWAPNTKDLKLIADQFNLGYEHKYSEYGMNIFGKYVYDGNTKTLTDYYLKHSDFEDFSWDEENDIETYKGKETESREEILEEIFKDKFGISY